MSAYHKPVLLNEAIEALDIKPDGIYVDVTFGGGGHSRAIIQKLKTGRLIAFDQDSDSKSNAIIDDKFTLIPQNFRHLKRFLKLHKATQVDGILADLGVSSHQIDTASRGFSTRFDALLDMRMDSTTGLSADHIINTYSADRLQNIFSQYGEISNSKTLAQAIVEARMSNPIRTTSQLIDLASPFVRGLRHKYLAKLFQAIRIEVNQEVESLKEMLEQSVEMLKCGGHLVVIAYHSLEDRLVKNFIKRGSFSGEIVKDFYGNQMQPLRSLSSKPVIPSGDEIKDNPRARSAKMRIGIKT